MNSKQALESICKTCDNKSCPYIHYEKSRCSFYGIIKQDLERLEMLEKENKVLREKVNHFKNVKNRYKRNQKFIEKENTKLKKVIEILINKNVNLSELYHLFKWNETTPTEYNEGLGKDYKLTQEEYDLLKEVIKNAK